MKRSFIPHAPHAEAVGVIVVVQRAEVARVEVEVARAAAASVVQRRGPIVAVGARESQLAAIAAAQARSREKQRALVVRVVITPEPTALELIVPSRAEIA